MAKFSLTIDMNNAAFAPYPESEISRLLIRVANVIGRSGLDARAGELPLRDVNGNQVGVAKVTP